MTEDKLEAAIMGRLKALGQLDTCTQFTRSFLNLIGTLIVQSRDPANIGGVFCDCLDLELWYHTRMAAANPADQGGRSELMNLNEKREISLQALAERLELAPSYRGAAGAARHLLLAECSYHLNLRHEAIQELRAAIDLGCDRPIVCFALGFNLFNLAVERHTRYLEGLDGLVITDRSAFNALCEEAIGILERGLADSSFDAQIHWRIGRIMEAMGRRDEAAAAYRRAERHDPLNFRAAVSRKLQLLSDTDGPKLPPDVGVDATRSAKARRGEGEPADAEEAGRFAALIRRAPRLARMIASDDFADTDGETG
jgi:tetratricopeptide (TPR) repeat protein